MSVFVCKKCGSKEIFIEEEGNQAGIYCDDCGQLIKRITKEQAKAKKDELYQDKYR